MIPMPHILVHLEQNGPTPDDVKKMRALFHRKGAIEQGSSHEGHAARAKTICKDLAFES